MIKINTISNNKAWFRYIKNPNNFIQRNINKLNKKNNLQEIKMNYIELDNITIPIQYNIKSKKFSANIYLKSYEINNQ